MANTNKTPKAQETKKAETKKVNPIEAITANLPTLVKARGTSSSIYKASLFEGQDDKGKKAIRRKVRRIRDQFLGAFIEKKGKPAELKGLQKDWMEFASQVYNDAKFIFEKNTSEEDQAICNEFTKAMAQEYK